MDQHWTWATTAAKRKRECTAYDSWEERAFAEDAAGLLGSGCVWPPRSYTCSFCRREFRSAQALGGHMNVHRRDRARLKQMPNTPQEEIKIPSSFSSNTDSASTALVNPTLWNNLNPSCKKLKSPSQNYPFAYKCPNPNSPNPLPSGFFYNPSSLSSFEDSSVHGSGVNHNLGYDHCIDYGKKDGSDENRVKSELSISLSLVVRKNRLEEEAGCLKRRKIFTTSPEKLPSLIFSSGASEIDTSREVHKVTNGGSLKEIDLELRLGG